MYGLMMGALMTAMASSGAMAAQGADLELLQARSAAGDCASEFRLMNPAAPQVAYADATQALCISGNIDTSLATAVVQELAVADRKVGYVVLSGESGELKPAMRIAAQIERLGATAVVQGRCASMCAQLLFVAAPRKVVLKEGMVWFYGGPLNPERIRMLSIPPAAKQSLLHDQEQFHQFYVDRDLDLRLVTQSPPQTEKDSERGVLMVWFWSASQLRSFGVSGVLHE